MKNLIFTRIAGIAIFTSLSVFFTSCGGHPSDETITDSVNSRLQAEPSLAGIKAAVADGTVTLTGTCEGENCNTKAEDMIKDVDGLKSVDNKVEPAVVTDLTLRSSVQEIISKYQGVTADVLNGEVVLRGSIDRSQVQPLMTELGELKPKKIDNQLAIK